MTSSMVMMSCYFLERMNTFTVESAMPAAITAPESDRVTQFSCRFVFTRLMDPMVGRFEFKFTFRLRFTLIFSSRIESS